MKIKVKKFNSRPQTSAKTVKKEKKSPQKNNVCAKKVNSQEVSERERVKEIAICHLSSTSKLFTNRPHNS